MVMISQENVFFIRLFYSFLLLKDYLYRCIILRVIIGRSKIKATISNYMDNFL